MLTHTLEKGVVDLHVYLQWVYGVEVDLKWVLRFTLRTFVEAFGAQKEFSIKLKVSDSHDFYNIKFNIIRLTLVFLMYSLLS